MIFFTPKAVYILINGQRESGGIYGSSDRRDSPIKKVILVQGSPDQTYQTLIDAMITRSQNPYSPSLPSIPIIPMIIDGHETDSDDLGNLTYIDGYQRAPFDEITQLLESEWMTGFTTVKIRDKTYLMFMVRSGEKLFTPGIYNSTTNQIFP